MPPLKIVAKKIPQLADFCTATLAGFYSAVDSYLAIVFTSVTKGSKSYWSAALRAAM